MSEGIGHTVNSVIVAASIELVWDLTNDVTTWPSLFSEYASVEIVDQHDETTRFRLTMRPDEAGRVWSWVSERTCDRPGRVVHARRVETGPFEFMQIEWRYRAVDGPVEATEMHWEQRFAMKPDAPVDDRAMTERINTNTMREMTRIKQIIEQAARAAARS